MKITDVITEAEKNPEPEQQQIDANRRAAQRREREPSGSETIDARLRAQNAQLQQYNETGKFWLKTKAEPQKHLEGPFVGKQAANRAALDLLKRAPELRGNLLITAYGPNEQQGVAEDWQKVNKSDKTDGMSKKAVKAYRRENPGSKLQTAVTKKPSELKAGSKDAKRRKSFCARMSGNPGPMKDEKGRPTPKAKALKRWNCNESLNEGKMAEVVYIIQALAEGDMDPYTVMNNPQGVTEQYVSRILHNEYEEVARNHRLHPDDDFEQILDIAVNNLARDYGVL